MTLPTPEEAERYVEMQRKMMEVIKDENDFVKISILLGLLARGFIRVEAPPTVAAEMLITVISEAVKIDIANESRNAQH